mmetsp:Transcript_46944/g.102075  ORF Transcript_46944/g.102075 Transcript_46944/m.102075 type:complete len:523 (+) Transcript_46944:92-1660(+)
MAEEPLAEEPLAAQDRKTAPGTDGTAEAAASAARDTGEECCGQEGGLDDHPATESLGIESDAPASIEGVVPGRDDVELKPSQLTWAQRIAAAAKANSPEVAEETPVEAPPRAPRRGTIVDYLMFLAERKTSQEDGAAEDVLLEVPEHLRSFEQSSPSAVGNRGRSVYARLGMRNDANNCYVNAAVQALLPCTALIWLLRHCAPGDPEKPFLACMFALCKEFHSRGQDAHGEVLNPLALAQVRNIVCRWQRLGAQQDAGEFLFYVLNGMHEECRWVLQPPSTASPGTAAEGGAEAEAAGAEASEANDVGGWAHVVKTSRRPAETRAAGWHEDSPILRIFGGLVQSTVRAKGAKTDSVSLEPFNHIGLNISEPNVTSVRLALEAFCNQETVNEGHATKTTQFKVLPPVLIICLKRFTYNRVKRCSEKIKKPIQYDQKLVLDSRWLAKDDGPDHEAAEYFISAVICHHGDSIHSGHYTAAVRYNSEWYMYDDAVVRPMELREVAALQNVAYLLLYQRVGTVDFRP